jgi:hypothetical protein
VEQVEVVAEEDLTLVLVEEVEELVVQVVQSLHFHFSLP